jgi:hypothetical protein
MVDGTISRGNTSVTFRLWQEGGNIVIGRDIGKPQGKFKTVSRQAPRSNDFLSSSDRFTVLGVLTGSNAYADAKTLAEDLVIPHSGGTPLQLDLTAVTGINTVYDIGVPSGNALQLEYRPGRRDRVDLQLSVPVVSATVG